MNEAQNEIKMINTLSMTITKKIVIYPRYLSVSCPNLYLIIDLTAGKVMNSKDYINTPITRKVRDNGIYTLFDAHMVELFCYAGYAPSMLSINEEGYGDYIDINIDENGYIENFRCDLTDFIEDDDETN